METVVLRNEDVNESTRVLLEDAIVAAHRSVYRTEDQIRGKERELEELRAHLAAARHHKTELEDALGEPYSDEMFQRYVNR